MIKFMNNQIRELVRHIMQEEGISSYKLADLLDMKQPNVTRVLTGRSGNIPNSWQKILDIFELELVAVPKGTYPETITNAAIAIIKE